MCYKFLTVQTIKWERKKESRKERKEESNDKKINEIMQCNTKAIVNEQTHNK